VRNGNAKAHTIGLGAMGLHTFLALNKMHYGSPESIEFTDLYFRLLNYYTLKASHQLAKERNKTFDGFEQSTYATGEYFDSYINETVTFKHEQV
ncbi:ribonucleotide-diphosphate reductase subunit alpha, partial [Rhizobium sp. KAs_5_22]